MEITKILVVGLIALSGIALADLPLPPECKFIPPGNNTTPVISDRLDNASPNELWSWGSAPKGKSIQGGRLVDTITVVEGDAWLAMDDLSSDPVVRALQTEQPVPNPKASRYV